VDLTKLIAIAGVLASLSVASERFVEIVKGLFPWLNTDKTATANPTPKDKKYEGWRRSAILLLAVVAGCLTSWLAWPAVSGALGEADIPVGSDSSRWILSLGVLASGGSSFWNSVLTYLLGVKDVMVANATEAKRNVVAPPANATLPSAKGGAAAGG
jgi:hypothetical protein